MPRLQDLGEFGFIRRVADLVGSPPSGVLQGIGDDCVVLEVDAPGKLLVTVDAALQGRHFDLAWMSPFEVGQRCMAGAVSDIAAMGGTPYVSLCTVALPPTMAAEDALELMRGIAQAGRRHGAPLIGGDTVSSPGPMVVDIAVLGHAEAPWLRSGARPGDVLLVTGHLGGARAALEILQHRPELMRDPRLAPLRHRLVKPAPRLKEAAALAGAPGIHAAIDISDGLYQDAGHIARSSGVRLEIDSARLPVSEACRVADELLPGNASWWAATSGEEYELLLSVDPRDVEALCRLLEARHLAPLTAIGRVESGEGVVLIAPDESEIEMDRGGWDHFRPVQ